jgi:hypothetical protein
MVAQIYLKDNYWLNSTFTVFHLCFCMRIILQSMVYTRFLNKKRGGKILVYFRFLSSQKLAMPMMQAMTTAAIIATSVVMNGASVGSVGSGSVGSGSVGSGSVGSGSVGSGSVGSGSVGSGSVGSGSVGSGSIGCAGDGAGPTVT